MKQLPKPPSGTSSPTLAFASPILLPSGTSSPQPADADAQCWGTWPSEVFSHGRPVAPSECQTEGASIFVEKANTVINLARFTCVVTTGMGRRSQCGGSGTIRWLTWLHEGFSAEGAT
jgi:hypothetical protein